jgi:hypothetical protein
VVVVLCCRVAVEVNFLALRVVTKVGKRGKERVSPDSQNPGNSEFLPVIQTETACFSSSHPP